ncbi:XylR N-terminal domain-containing protein [Sporosarcina sp. ACRSM]|uniref:XylR N-terminal domain-containing protein n=1 Tax=Sporosarcina sp. ACRSM TaxID=2918216 RepID=UPI001EF50B6D|nr:XylR N-terminal domain-containing protein [Sporosarcina sp. ACRSM]MCG7334921.1 XylR N-terminal domain-containing protein [Sporosarcina sp. ACRSM]
MTIQASELTLDHLMHISTKPGINLTDLNFTLMSMEAWGFLRKDLITALGVQRAKRFLLRYAYNCGAHEARMLKDKINWKDDMEWLLAGSKMHSLTGRSLSYPEEFYVDLEKKTFNVSGYWIDSYEAKQHLEHFPMHSEPICYFLIGYASGYTSACVGKKIIFKEVKCRGKGDDHCSYIGKTVEEWGDDISEELLFYVDDDMSGELDQMYRKVELEKERFRIGSSLSRNLTTAMLKGEGFPAFAELLGKSLHCPVLIENSNFKLLAQYGDNPGMTDYMSAENFWPSEYETAALNHIIVTDLKDKTFKLLTTSIVVRNQVHGYITIALDQKSDDFHEDLLERVATIAALYLQNERIALETEQRLKGELVEQLLNDDGTEVGEIHNRLSSLGYNLTEPHYIMHIDINNPTIEEDNTTNDKYMRIRNQLTTSIQNADDQYNMLILTKLNTIQVIVAKKWIENQRTTIKKFGEKLLGQVVSSDRQICIGISNETRKLSDFNTKAQEAKKAVELAKYRTSKSEIVLSNELGHLTLFLNAREPAELEAFAKGKLSPVLEYDEKRNSELLQTLFYYSQNEFNLHKTAREMSISISGMRYRIQQIEDLLYTDLSDSNSRFEIQIALQIFLTLGRIQM